SNQSQQPAPQLVELDPETAIVFQHGLASHQRGQLAQAKTAYEQVLAKQPQHFDALHLLGVIAAQSNNPALAEELIGKAIEINPNCAPAFSNRGNALQELKRFDEAILSFDKAIALKPDYADAFYNRGNALQELKHLEAALLSYDKAIALKPDYADALYNRGVVLTKLKRPGDAVLSHNQAIILKPDYAAAFYHRGIALKELKLLDDALLSYDRAITLKPDYADALNNRGNVLKEMKRLEDALSSYDKAITLKPDYADAFNNRGNVLKEMKRLEDALSSYHEAIALKPDYIDAFYNRGITLHELLRQEDALSSYDKAIALKPDYADAFNNRGIVLKEMRRLEDALSDYDNAIALKNDHAYAFNNRGNAVKELYRFEDALSSYDRAISLKSDYVDAFYNRGLALQELKLLDEALLSYNDAITLKPDYDFLYGIKLHTQMHLCDWSNLQNQMEELEASLAKDQKVIPPFPLLGLMDKPALHMKASRIYANEKYPAPGKIEPFKNRPSDGKIRIGYYSADFHNHATSFLMAELFEAHDKRKIELYGFSFGPDKQDEMRSRISSTFCHFFDVAKKSDREIAQMSMDLGIDIAVDLKGFTQDSRIGIFAERCAPLQVNYLGYPGTLAAPYFDYIVADKNLIPRESQDFYTEKIIYLPHSYQVNDSKRKISDKVFTRQELGLPESGFVFCCFNNNYKILPETFDVWMRLLKTVNGSVLWLLQDNPTAAKHLRKEAEKRGVNPARLVFAPRMTLEDHLARHRAADLFVDTLPYNAHTTASDALWAGLPVLTQMGESFAARVAASLLSAMDLPELITKNRQEYEARAIELASDPLQLAEIRDKVGKNRLTSPLFNGRLFARNMEAAYSEIHRRHLHGEQPDHIDVDLLTN
ncbi:tetratricopeptide repeat protein, partial [Acidovorax sp.]|uniref:tetratricopeptide repeat protein n=1 Tax=Acidovorax sp. TaxID=1872122 RepID=UPI00391F77A6